MTPPIAKWTVGDFNRKAAEGPAPAGVAVAAVSASFALSLLMMTLENAAKKNADPLARERTARLLAAAESWSARMMKYADEDIAAFDEYLKSLRLPKNQPEERQRAIDAALRHATEIPLAIARLALSGLDLCAEAADLAHRNVLADLGAAAALLQAAVRAVLGSAESNLARMTAESRARHPAADRRELRTRADSRAEYVLEFCAKKLPPQGDSI
ncbi:MAG: cyclodeaminase/cyclohydrolase family protein [Candidatus Binataceae bacterium]